MSPSLFRSQLRFLLDENIKKELLKFLKSEGYDITFKPKGLSNGKLASLSKSENRVLITNDVDFADPFLYPRGNIFSIVWLRIPQDKPSALLESFAILLKDKSRPEDFEGFLVELREDGKFKFSAIKSSESKTLKDIEELQLKKKIREISEIDEDDTREVKESVAKEVIASIEKTSKELKSGKRKPMSLEEFNKWCDSA